MKTRAFDQHGRPALPERGAAPTSLRRVISRFTSKLRRTRVPEAPSAEEAKQRIEGRPTLLSTLTAEQLAACDAYEGTEFVGRREPTLK